jgi:hypothetical protein
MAANEKLVVYTIVTRERDGRKFWVRIGDAARERDGSINAQLDALPTNGTLHIRKLRQGLDGLLPRAGDQEPADTEEGQ